MSTVAGQTPNTSTARHRPHPPSPTSGPNREEVLALRREYQSPGLVTYYQDPLMLVEGHMQYVWDETGKQYLDGFAGIVSVSVGHCHPSVTAKVQEQVGTLGHTTTLYLNPAGPLFAQKLAQHMPEESRLTVSLFHQLGERGERAGGPDESRVHRQHRGG